MRLAWNPLDYGGITHFYVPQKNLWIPELSISDAHDVNDFQSEQQKTAWVTYNGTIGYYTSCVVSVVCQMNVFKFPMDSHICSINVLFHQCYKNEYEIINYPANISWPIGQLGNGEWQIEWINSTTVYGGGFGLSDVQQTVAKIKRNPGFYISLVIIPAFFINVLSIVALFINVEATSEKFGIGLTNIMAMTFILAILADDLPKTKNIPLLAIYVIISLVIIVVALLSILILNNFRKLFKNRTKKDSKKIEIILLTFFELANFINFLMLFL
ncbi:unnamed protein product [Caenorhabditis angaria]|uniref:Neurotransmitter-gated ion-channel ligand-binding domain-containing protein n=1 Tax=Caenorhabditis angaria TaxID=860376 RepID=A0A9P1N794_9PELO|nr:unnamed protein product [Caenorhabditis angaria]